MRNNKGYSLAELLLSIAIFSIVMISIVTVMRNVSISYRNENAEVQLQENSQILLSQIEEMLVDCDNLEGSGTDTDPYKITQNTVNSAGNPVVIVQKIKKVGDKVYYQYNSSEYEELASNVQALTISDFAKTNNSGVKGDNRCVVTVEMVNNIDGKNNNGHEYTYEASKDIVFRNDVEKAPVHNSDFLTNNTGNPNPINTGSADSINVEIGRYQVLNLYSEYNCKPSSTITLTPVGTAGYRFIKDPGSNNTVPSLTSSDAFSNTATGYITTNGTCNSDTASTYKCKIEFTTNDNKNITLNVSTKPVQLKKGSGVIYVPQGACNDGTNKNFYSYIEIEGICIRDLKKYYNTDCTGEIKFSYNAGSGYSSYSVTGSGKVFCCTDNWKSASYYKKSDGNKAEVKGPNNNYCNQTAFGIGYDPYGEDTLCIMFTGDLQAKDMFNNLKYNAQVKVTYPSGNSTDYDTEDYKVFTSGANLSTVTTSN